MKKVIFIIILGIFFSSGALVYQNRSLSLNIDKAEGSLVNAFNNIVATIQGAK